MIAITVAYRDRREHLEEFAPYMHEYLDGKDYEIYVIEQEPGRRFNRSKLMNVGYDIFHENHNTFVFHDVDMLPEDTVYREVGGPEHWCGTATQFNARGGRPYANYFGGVTAVDRESFKAVNGFSNEYWGWGCEDDDLRERFHKEGIDITWRDFHYNSLNHSTESHSHENLEDMRRRFHKFANGNGYNHQLEGLNTLDYEVLEREEVLGCEKVTVSI